MCNSINNLTGLLLYYIKLQSITIKKAKKLFICLTYLKLSYFSGTLILVILVRGLVIAKFNTH